MGQIEGPERFKDCLVGDGSEAANSFASLSEEALVGRVLTVEHLSSQRVSEEDMAILEREIGR